MELVIVFGPPAVGKMTVGQALAEQTGFALLHNHVTIEPLLPYFPFHSAPFRRLNRLFRSALIEEIARSDHRGLIFTYVWALDVPDDRAEIEALIERFGKRPEEVCFVELHAPQPTRLERNRTPNRLDHKRSKRDLAWSDDNLRECDARYALATSDALPFFYPERHLRLDTSSLDPADAASAIRARFGLDEAPT